ncbi:MAG: hypothetical protein E6G03_03700 [Actinobacteria bacterium]|nr:MAG: hypothetical protein E6G03_03700 [Actinomycetota bacterium]
MRDTVVSVLRAACLLLGIAAVAGCGGSGGYAAKADAICKKYTKQTNAFPKPSNVAELADVADRTLPILDRAAKELGALEPPVGKRAAADRWLAQFRKLREDLREIRDRARTGDTKGVAAVAVRAQQDSARANELGTRLGFKVCNRN